MTTILEKMEDSSELANSEGSKRVRRFHKLGDRFGLDIGNGFLKWHYRGTENKIPTVFVEGQPQASFIYDGRSILTGRDAMAAKLSVKRVVDSPLNKVEMSDIWLIQALVSADIQNGSSVQLNLSTVNWADTKTADALRDRLSGVKSYAVDGEVITVTIEVDEILPEGFAYARGQGSIGLIDLGHGTTILSTSKGGKTPKYFKVLNLGQRDLVDQFIALSASENGGVPLANGAARKMLASGQIEPRFKAAHKTALTAWLTEFKPAITDLKEACAEQGITDIHAIGGGCEDPTLKGVLTKNGFIVAPNPTFANAIALAGTQVNLNAVGGAA